MSKNLIQSDLAFKIYTDLKSAINQQGFLFLFIGRTLKEIKDQEIFKSLGYEDFRSFLLDPELKQKPSTSYAYIRVYEYYVEKLGLAEQEVAGIGINRLQRLLPALKNKTDDEAKNLITEVGTLTHLDYNQVVRENGLDIPKPSMYRDAETGKWIIEFDEAHTVKIYNKTKNEVLYGF